MTRTPNRKDHKKSTDSGVGRTIRNANRQDYPATRPADGEKDLVRRIVWEVDWVTEGGNKGTVERVKYIMLDCRTSYLF